MQFDRQCEVRNGPESLGLRLIAESPQQRGVKRTCRTDEMMGLDCAMVATFQQAGIEVIRV